MQFILLSVHKTRMHINKLLNYTPRLKLNIFRELYHFHNVYEMVSFVPFRSAVP